MKTYHSILVGIDFSPASRSALRAAIRIAAFDNAKVTAVHVLDPDLAAAIKKVNGFTEQELNKVTEDSVYRFLAESELGAEAVQIHVQTGHPLAVLMDACLATGADLLVLGTQGIRHKAERVGVVAAKCVRKAPADVLLVRADSSGQFHKALVCIDLSEAATRTMQAALHVSECDRTVLDCVYVCRTPMAMTADYGAYLPGVPIVDEEEIQLYKKDLDSFVFALAPEAKSKGWQNFVLGGASIREVLSLHAQENKCDLVVLGTKGAGNWAEMLLGTTAESIVAHAATSILAVKPERPVAAMPDLPL